jgi:two-component system, LytTR family, response regulator
MTPLRALVVEDEPPSRARLVRLLAAHADTVAVVGEAATADEARTALVTLRPDVVFLDVELPGGSGLALLPLLGSIRVVFVTAYAAHAVEAFAAGAVDFLVKPVAPERLATTVARLRERAAPVAPAVLAELARALRPPEPEPVSIPVRRGEGVTFLPLDTVTHFEAKDKVVFAHTLGGRSHLVDRSLAALLERLPGHFVQVHRAVVVNRRHLQSATRRLGGGRTLTLAGGARVATGPSFAEAVDGLLRW